MTTPRDYAERLNRAVDKGAKGEWKPIFEAMIADKNMKRRQVIEVANLMQLPAAPSSTKKRALERIRNLGIQQDDFISKLEASAGRSAA